jgi:VanZ family protein
MSSSQRGPWFWISVWCPVALGMIMIAIESQEFMGSNYTAGPLRHFFEKLFGHVSEEDWDIVHHYMRKSGHFLGYGLIGLAWLRAWWKTLPHSHFFQDALLALLGTAAIASCDEWHQTFLPNRTGTPVDVFLDCTGSLVLQLLVYFYFRLFQPKKLTHVA